MVGTQRVKASVAVCSIGRRADPGHNHTIQVVKDRTISDGLGSEVDGREKLSSYEVSGTYKLVSGVWIVVPLCSKALCNSLKRNELEPKPPTSQTGCD